MIFSTFLKWKIGKTVFYEKVTFKFSQNRSLLLISVFRDVKLDRYLIISVFQNRVKDWKNVTKNITIVNYSTPRCKIEQMSVKKITIVNYSIPRCKVEHKKVTFDFSQKRSLLLIEHMLDKTILQSK